MGTKLLNGIGTHGHQRIVNRIIQDLLLLLENDPVTGIRKFAGSRLQALQNLQSPKLVPIFCISCINTYIAIAVIYVLAVRLYVLFACLLQFGIQVDVLALLEKLRAQLLPAFLLYVAPHAVDGVVTHLFAQARDNGRLRLRRTAESHSVVLAGSFKFKREVVVFEGDNLEMLDVDAALDVGLHVRVVLVGYEALD